MQDGVMPVMTVKLDGKNFNIWSQMLKMKLSGKDKLVYIIGTSSQPSGNTNPKWNMEDELVKDYIINSMDSSLIGNFLPFSTTKKIWDAVRTTYFHRNDLTQLLELKRKVNRVKQSSGTIKVYYTQLQGLWKELDCRRSNPMTNPVVIEIYNRLLQEDQVLSFLDGLDDCLDHIGANVLQVQLFPTIEHAFALVRREDNRQTVILKGGGLQNPMVLLTQNQKLNMQKSSSSTRPNNSLYCSNCDKTNHTKEKCYKIIWFPDWYKGQKKGKQREANKAGIGPVASTPPGIAEAPIGSRGGSAQGEAVGSVSVTHSNGLSLVPAVEYGKQNEGKVFISHPHSNIKESYNWIIDSGATDHMTFTRSDFVNEYKARRSEILNANGVSYPVMSAGDVQISSSMALSNTLLVPSLSTKLLSVGQICEEMNCCVLMFSCFCLFQDIQMNEIIGRGSKRRGLYHLDDMAT